MCVACRNRFFQDELIRLQCIDNNLSLFKGTGRSFYVCDNCINSKKFLKFVSKMCNLDIEKVKKILKEYA